LDERRFTDIPESDVVTLECVGGPWDGGKFTLLRGLDPVRLPCNRAIVDAQKQVALQYEEGMVKYAVYRTALRDGSPYLKFDRLMNEEENRQLWDMMQPP
jgi:hypothetical protein